MRGAKIPPPHISEPLPFCFPTASKLHILLQPPEKTTKLESVQDFLIKLDMKLIMHLSSGNKLFFTNFIVRLTKFMNNLFKHIKMHAFKVNFLCLKLVESFPKKIFIRNIGLGD